MGYTHYWSFKPPKRGQAAKVEAAYQRAIKDCTKVAKAWQATANEWDRLSGYTAHAKAGAYGGLHVNGKGSEAHEDFIMREHYKQNKDTFCKTARKSYDTVVVACLIILKYHLKDNFEVASDGQFEDWIAGLALCAHISHNIAVPLSIRHSTESTICPNCNSEVVVCVTTKA